MQPSLRVFVSHSFDDSDIPLVNKVLSVLKAKNFNFEVVTARRPTAGKIEDNIVDLIDRADVTFGIFTKRYTDSLSHWVPPPYVISECSLAKGRYHDDARKGVHGIVEHGIEHKELGLATLSGQNFPSFRREAVLAGETKWLKDYLTKVQNAHGSALTMSPQRPYKQRLVNKTVEILRNGTGIFKNTVAIEILDAARVTSIQHELWLPPRSVALPPLAEMAKTVSTQRSIAPFFHAVCFLKNGVAINKAMKIEIVRQARRSVKLKLSFPFGLRNHDVLNYQYIWSAPGAFTVFEDDMAAADYNEVAFRAPHGRIGDARLKLKFEREVVHGASADLFNKAPFIVRSYHPSEDGIMDIDPIPMSIVEHDATWEIFQFDVTSMTGALVAKWRPSSRATVQSSLDDSQSHVNSGSDDRASETRIERAKRLPTPKERKVAQTDSSRLGRRPSATAIK